MAAIQLSFSLRTTSNVKQVHLIGSWDGYQGQMPLSRESGSSKWKGTFRFQPNVMQAGQRYWFYYMLDGYQVSHDPSKEFTQEPTTGRHLNILDVPMSASSSKSSRHSKSSSSSSRRYSRELPRGRPASEIRSPMPVRPGKVAKQLEAAARTQAALDAMNHRFSRAKLSEYSDEDSDIEDESDSDVDSDVPSLSSGGSTLSGCSSPSSVSSASSDCTCNRYGVTRAGERVKLDCGGSRCGYEHTSEESSSDDDDGRQYQTRISDSKHRHSTSRHSTSKHSNSNRRHGVVIR